MPSDFAVYDGRGTRRRFDILFGSEAVSTCSVDSIHCLRVLSVGASEEMPATAERDHFCSAVGFCGLRRYLNILPSSNGECGRRITGTVIFMRGKYILGTLLAVTLVAALFYV